MDKRIVTFVACLLGAACLHQVILKQGTGLGLSHPQVAILGAAAGVVVSKLV